MVDLYTTLPRIDCEVIRIIRHYVDKDGGPISKYKSFIIRKSKVLQALNFLKDHNPLYANVTIDENNLSWMGTEEETELHNIINTKDDEKYQEGNKNTSVSNTQTKGTQEYNVDKTYKLEEYGGVMSENTKLRHKHCDKKTISELVHAVQKSGKKSHLWIFHR